MRKFNFDTDTTINAVRIAFFSIGLPFAVATSNLVFATANVVALTFSCLWFLLELVGIVDVKRHGWLIYPPTFLDSIFISLFVVLTGNASSIVAAAYIYIITICSMNVVNRHGEVALILALSTYALANFGVYFGAFPAMNIFGGQSEITLGSLLFSLAFMSLAGVAMFAIVKRLVRQEANLRIQVAAQKDKVEELLNNILPKAVVEEINRAGRCSPIRASAATVLFTDFVDFSVIVRDMHPEDVVALLDSYFTLFDVILQKHGIEKLKTIGDGYMCVSGVPEYRADHVERMIEAASEILETVKSEGARRSAEGLPFFDVRIGVHTGEVCAGVIGRTKFSYDIWGEVVNLASRLETAAEVNSINVSKEVRDRICHRWPLAYRGKVPTKNHGEVEMYKLS